jgi:hypothetical protein
MARHDEKRPHPFHHHHDRAREQAELDGSSPVGVALGLLNASIALIWVQAAQWRELRKIRRALEALVSNQSVRLNLTGRLVLKDGDSMATGPFNPTESQDVAFSITPVNAAGEPTSGPFTWTVSDPNSGTLVVSSDTKSARLVTSVGNIDTVLIVEDPASGKKESTVVSRAVQPPPDNMSVALNLSGELIDKAAV